MSCKITFKDNKSDEWIELQEVFDENILIVKMLISSATNKTYFYVKVSNKNPEIHSCDTFLVKIEGEYLLTTPCFSRNISTLHTEPIASSNIPSNSFALFSKEITKSTTIYAYDSRKNTQSFEHFKSTSGTNLRGLYNNSLYYDVVLVSADGEAKLIEETINDSNTAATFISGKINAHKAVLSNNSEYFKKLFSSGFGDSMQREVTISCQQEVLEVIVLFIYTKDIKENVIASADFDFWHQVFVNSQMMEIDDLTKISQWLSLCYLSPTNAYIILKMCLEYKNCGIAYRDVLKFLDTNWDKIPHQS